MGEMKILRTFYRIFRDIFYRKHFREIRFISGTITYRECLLIVYYLIFKRKSILDGVHIKQYEDKFAKYLGVKHAFSFGAGRMAFYSLLKSFGVGDGDEVILPGYTCVVVPAAIVYCGAKPIYVDIDPDTLCIDVDKIEEKITPRTKVIYAQHTFASFCDMGAITDIAKRYNLKVIEDCAHALGAEYDGKKAGTFGDAAYFTTEQSKIISTGMGGMAVTNDDKLAESIAKIQNDAHFFDKKTIKKISIQMITYNVFLHPWAAFIGKYFLYLFNKWGLMIQSTTCDEMNCIIPDNYPVKLSNIQSRIGLMQLGSIGKNIEHRRKIANVYRKSLENTGIRFYEANDPLYEPVYIRYALLVRDRDNLKKTFQNNQIELGEWFNSVIHPQGSSYASVYYELGSCPIAEDIVKHNINLPTHPKVKKSDAVRCISILTDYGGRD